MHFQPSMPRLPIPELNDTLNNYLYFVSPLISPADMIATRAAVEAFRTGDGPKVHAALVADDKKHPETSYISAMWYDMYLQTRDPFPLNLTPQLTWKLDADPKKNDQATRAADLIHAATRFYLALRANSLKPDVFHTKPHLSKHPLFETAVSLLPSSVSYYGAYFAGAYPLDMSQYSRLFNSTRIPLVGRDELRTAATASEHVLVLRGPDFFRVRVLNGSTPVAPALIEAQLRGILQAPRGAGAPVAALTAGERDSWARTRAAMEQDPTNAAALKLVDESMFALTLEDAAPDSHEAISWSMLTGDCRNRWFDKSFNIMVCANGRSGISWEHSWGDGVAVLNFFNEVFDAITAAPARAASAPQAGAEPISFRVNSEVAAAIQQTCAESDRVRASCDLHVYRSETMTKDDVKRSNLSPDGLMQMILQLAHHRAHGFTPSTYESASTAGFKHGRTETIRSATPEAAEFCAVMDRAEAPATDKFAALKKATERHTKTTRDCLMGKGVDRHLFALDKWSERLGLAKPALFTDKGWRTMKDIRLSTSTLSSHALDGGGFGPVSRTSYGVGYGIEARGAQFHVTSYGQGNDKFIAGLESGLRDVQKVIAAAAPASATKP